ncbi:MAG: rhodanese-like domain-containing protein [Gammaproteobacteria bacterium]|nr:rhodanese-like domain-containing protein [Gammaproteobacteria bacterium]MCZ6912694.1 rhodanese-like domain-containing protein [Pseudomonadota bacterium]
MSQLLDFASNHPYLVGGVVVLSILVLGNELRLRRNAGSFMDPASVVSLINKGAAVLDLRSAERFATGHVVGARNIPVDELESSAAKLKRYTGKPLIVYCDNGTSCGKALVGLQKMGLEHAVAMRGGLQAWTQENMPLVKD